ncbi:hypothetical protein [Helicobacter pylori]|nr:hypothetical protein [Helicobacter pylori]QQW86945.1 hypothetical protein HG567_06110 [Helicobacter pylori]WQW69197.1 hypothetical protein KVM29_05940 [Helicobacter pylori]
MNKHKAIKPSSPFLSKIAKLILSPLSNAIKIAAKIPRIATKSLFVLSICLFMVLVWFVMLLISSLRLLGFVALKIKDHRLTIIIRFYCMRVIMALVQKIPP